MSEFIKTVEKLGDDAVMDGIIDRSITEFHDDVITSLPAYTFYGCKALKTVRLPKLTVVESSVFQNCTALEEAELPLATMMWNDATNGCTSLKRVHAPLVTELGSSAIVGCATMKSIDFPLLKNATHCFGGFTMLESVNLPELTTAISCFGSCPSLVDFVLPKLTELCWAFGECGMTVINDTMFPEVTKTTGRCFWYSPELTRITFPKVVECSEICYYCNKLVYADFPSLTKFAEPPFRDCPLETLILRSPTVCTLGGALGNKGTCYIYVPKALVNSYKSATNWSQYANQIRAIEDYPDITGG